ALLPVHLFGHPSRMGELNELAKEKSLHVIEDACQAHGASIDGRKAGSLGDAGCFSFYPTKNMTVGGDGGMITTNDGELAKKLAKLRDCGRISRYVHDVVGYTSRLNTANAAFGRVQLRNLDGWNERRRQIAAKYDDLLADVPELHRPPRGGKGIVPVYHLYAIHCQRRDDLASQLQAKGIECGVHYPVPIHMQPIYRSLYGYKGGEWPVAERLSDSLLSLPMFPALKDAEIRYVAETVRSFYGR
ncbi:MAG TPA: DegT/DnrJ/EryC1/StrS family aminotransferase, partial [Methanomassiliicoccales archaeon]|nr:DegT/DnrJ/EryC1/StrS family aminotransferase [Methanomassiliicoccales archaeon]